MSWLSRNRYHIARRTVQLGVLVLLWAGAHAGSSLLKGDLSSSLLLGTVPMSDPLATLQILATGHIPGKTVLLGALVVVGMYFLLGGRVFCSWVCPVNPITDLGQSLKRQVGPKRLVAVPRTARIWVLGLTLVVTMLTGIAAFELISPIGMISRELIFAPALGLLAIPALVLADAFVLQHGWCGSLCPLGALYAGVGAYSPVRIRFDRERCDRCGDCVPICPESQVIRFDELERKGFVDSGFCTNCAGCIEVCTRGAYRFGLRTAARTNTHDERVTHA